MAQNVNAYYLTWNIQNNATYLYGSDVKQIDDNRLSYRNLYIPSGTVLYSWRSRVHFESERYTNQLPRLERKKRYTIGYNITTLPENATYLKVDMKDIMKDVIETIVVKQGEEISFEVNERLDSYTIELVSSGVNKFVFDNIIIRENTREYEVDRFWLDSQFSSNEETLTLVFVEPLRSNLSTVDKSLLQKLSNVVIINSDYTDGKLYLHEALVHAVDNMIKLKRPQKISCVGYGPITNFAATYYAERYDNGRAIVTDNWFTVEKYRELLEQENMIDVRVKDIVFEQYNKEKVDRVMIDIHMIDEKVLPFIDLMYPLERLLDMKDGNKNESAQYEYN